MLAPCMFISSNMPEICKKQIVQWSCNSCPLEWSASAFMRGGQSWLQKTFACNGMLDSWMLVSKLVSVGSWWVYRFFHNEINWSSFLLLFDMLLGLEMVRQLPLGPDCQQLTILFAMGSVWTADLEMSVCSSLLTSDSSSPSRLPFCFFFPFIYLFLLVGRRDIFG